MKNIFYSATLLFILFTCQAFAQPTDLLKQKIVQITSTKNAEVGISIIGGDRKDTLNLNGDKHFPMQSVFKFHIALAVLSEIDKGKFSLTQKIKIPKEDLFPKLYSPIREKYPNGATLTIAQILDYTVSESDNVGCEILLKLVGGPEAVEAFFTKNNIDDVSIKINEVTQQDNWDLQFKNWTTPKAANAVLEKFYNNKAALLSKKSYDFIWKTMKATQTGKYRLKGQLPTETIVAHKTGSSGVNKEGLTAAVNDIGVVFLPNGKHYFISVFVTNSKEDTATNERIIADISKVTWDFFVEKTKQN